MLLDSDKEVIKEMIREGVTQALAESKKEIQDGVKGAIIGAKNEQPLTKEQILETKEYMKTAELHVVPAKSDYIFDICIHGYKGEDSAEARIVDFHTKCCEFYVLAKRL